MIAPSMATLTLLLLLPFSTVLAQQCIWKNGQEATDYFACDPTSAQSSCCLQGEACVGNGLCYGSLGIIYRGACAGGWGNDTACPQYCNDAGFDGGWANLLHCPTIPASSSGAATWWCGEGNVVPCDETGTEDNPTSAQFFSMQWNGLLPKAIMPWPSQNFTGCAIDPGNQYSLQRQIENVTENSIGDTCSSNSNSNSNSSTTSTTTAEQNCPNGVIIGEGVAIGVLALVAVAMAAWAFYERRQKNALIAGQGRQQQQQYETQQYQTKHLFHDTAKGYSTPVPEYPAPRRMPASEMDSTRSSTRALAHEMQS